MKPWPGSIALCIAVLIVGASAQAGAQPVDRGAAELESSDGPGGKFALPAGVRADRDVAYGPAPAQKLDVYASQGAKNAPVVLMVHGGAWMLGDKGNSAVVANKLKHWLPRGYIVVSANYRMAPPPNPMEQAEDVGRALAFVQANASSWGGDGSRVVLMGHSSGAHLVTLLSATPAAISRSGAKPWLGTVSLDSAALDVVELMNARHMRLHDRVFGADPRRWAELSPVQQLSGRTVPMLLVCASRREDSCSAARRFAAKAVSLGGRASVVPVDFAHGEVNSELGRSPGYNRLGRRLFPFLGLALIGGASADTARHTMVKFASENEAGS